MSTEVQDIMSAPITSFPANYSTSKARKKMEKGSIDVAPLEEVEKICKFVRRKDLEVSDGKDELIDYAYPIESKHLVGKDLPILVNREEVKDLVQIWVENQLGFSFVVDKGISGIVTLADLNKPEAGMPFYNLFITYDSRVSNFISNNLSPNEWLELLGSKSDDVEEDYTDERSENAEIKIEYCLSTRQLGKVIVRSDLWKDMGFETKKKAREQLVETLPDFRNDVMHPHKLVYEGQKIERVDSIINDVREIISRLSEQWD